MISVRSNYIHIAFPIFQFFKKKKKLYAFLLYGYGGRLSQIFGNI